MLSRLRWGWLGRWHRDRRRLLRELFRRLFRRQQGRLARERRTVAAMIALYCRAHHQQGAAASAPGRCCVSTAEASWLPPHKGARQPGELCPHCTDLLAYAEARLARCRFGEDKPVCSQCPVHCFKPTRREEIRVVMRYVGPRMARRRPYLALMHLWDRRRRAPVHAKAFSDALSQPREPESKELAAQADSVNG